LSAQNRLSDFLGWSGGVSLSFGSHVNRIGLQAQAYYVQDFVQINALLAGYYSFTELGPRPPVPGWELQTGIGGLVGFGPGRREGENPFLSLVGNQTDRQYAAAYAFQWYRDQRETSQVSGSVGFHLGPFQAVMENDVLVGGIEDKFRTGAVLLGYQQDRLQFGTKVILWTGDTRSEGVKRFGKSETDYRGRYGYKDLSQGKYGRFSHGIASLQVQAALPFGQIASLSVGLDSERVRHVIQNVLIHDMWFLPAGWIKARNPHVPMLDRAGNPYLFRPDQQVRAPRMYFSGALNAPLFY
jgi:hypothetical protein